MKIPLGLNKSISENRPKKPIPLWSKPNFEPCAANNAERHSSEASLKTLSPVVPKSKPEIRSKSDDYGLGEPRSSQEMLSKLKSEPDKVEAMEVHEDEKP